VSGEASRPLTAADGAEFRALIEEMPDGVWRASAVVRLETGELRAAGVTSLNGIAAALDERHIPTPGGSGHWHAAQVARLLKRLAARARWVPHS
jgi:hypothetical protein